MTSANGYKIFCQDKMYLDKKNNKLIFILILLFATNAFAKENLIFNNLSGNGVAHYLGWINNPKTNNLCGGYYKEPLIIVKYLNPASAKTENITITAEKQAFYSTQGDSILTGKVRITQPGRQITADKVILHRDKITNKIANADLIGHVNMREYGKLIISNHANINFLTKKIVLNNSIYRLAIPSATGPVNLFGRATEVIRDKSKTLTLYNATYSTCQPNHCAWQISSKKLQLNSQEQKGTVNNALLFLSGVPIFYTPYLRFPIGHQRKTGFIFPSFAYSNDNGAEVSLPLYLNIAPNYDDTITARAISRRGLLGNNNFRYLTANSAGQIKSDYIVDDKQFNLYKHSAASQYIISPVLSRLENSSNNRGYFAWQNYTKFNQQWSSNINLSYVTDDYFFHDFGNTPAVINHDQLLDQTDLNYASNHWRFQGRVQAFQTLRMLTQNLTTDNAQYSRLPQLNLNGNYPNQNYGLNYQLNNEFVYFDHSKDLFTGNPIVTGARANIQPGISRSINWDGIYIEPRLQLPATFYQLHNQTAGSPRKISRAIPVFNLDNGLTLTRQIKFLSGNYTQTLEPRIFYLYVPYQNQNDIPVFDTDTSAYTFDSLFRTNRFNGYDRIGDANQISFALTTKFFDADSGAEKLTANIGQIFAFQKHKICISGQCTTDPLTNYNNSPLIGELLYYINSNWNITTDAAWDFNRRRLNNSGTTFQYRHNTNSIINIGYNYVADGDIYNGKTVSLNRINVSGTWQLTRHFNAVGDWNYNISGHTPQAYLYGIEYNSCCWALRLVNSNVFTGYDQRQKAIFDHRFYVQFLLKGLGNIGTNDAGSLLTSRVSGYHDNFASGSIYHI